MIISIIVFVVACIVLRVLRGAFKWVDWVAYALVFIPPITVWISDGFWSALLIFLVCALLGRLLFGIGHQDEVTHQGRTGRLKECKNCGYEYHDIIDRGSGYVIAKCRRCGYQTAYIWD